MQKPPLDPDVADTAPNDSVLTAYDEKHLITYLRLLDADAESADWHEVARIVLHLDPEHESDRAGRAFDRVTGTCYGGWRVRLKRTRQFHEERKWRMGGAKRRPSGDAETC